MLFIRSLAQLGVKPLDRFWRFNVSKSVFLRQLHSFEG